MDDIGKGPTFPYENYVTAKTKFYVITLIFLLNRTNNLYQVIHFIAHMQMENTGSLFLLKAMSVPSGFTVPSFLLLLELVLYTHSL